MSKFDEKWLLAHQSRIKTLAVPHVALMPLPAPLAATPRADILIRLAAPTMLMNRWERLHWTKRREYKMAMALEILQAMGDLLPMAPIDYAELTIWRHSIREPDPDGLIIKHVADCLQPSSPRHPYGLGIITDDNSKHLVCNRHHVQAKTRADQHTLIRIRNLIRGSK